MHENAAKLVMRRKARTFFLASRFLPRPIRSDVEILYSYFRFVDDLADEPGSRDAKAVLEEIESDLSAPQPAIPLMGRVRHVLERHRIPPILLTEVIHGARRDLTHSTPPTFDELYAYADLVAGSVGAALCHMLGDVTDESLLAARYLGIAMQLTNILRDVGEDLQRGRIYIPLDDMRLFNYSRRDLAQCVIDARFEALMQLEMYRADQFYCAGLKGIHFLDPRVRPAIVVAAHLYRRILRKIEQSGFDVFGKRAVVPGYEKVLSLRTAMSPGWLPPPRVPVVGLAEHGFATLAAKNTAEPRNALSSRLSTTEIR
jgi:15-cis-phytoene synthase